MSSREFWLASLIMILAPASLAAPASAPKSGAPRRKASVLILDSSPSGAAVYVGLDGVGRTPLEKDLAPDRYTVTARKGAGLWSGEVTIRPRAATKLTVTLKAPASDEAKPSSVAPAWLPDCGAARPWSSLRCGFLLAPQPRPCSCPQPRRQGDPGSEGRTVIALDRHRRARDKGPQSEGQRG